MNNCDVLERRRTARLKFVESKRTKDSYTVSGDVINFNGPTAGLLRVADACVVLQHMSRTFVRSSYTVKMFVAGREVSFCATNCRARRDQILIKFGQRTPRYSDMLSVIDSVDGRKAARYVLEANRTIVASDSTSPAYWTEKFGFPKNVEQALTEIMIVAQVAEAAVQSDYFFRLWTLSARQCSELVRDKVEKTSRELMMLVPTSSDVSYRNFMRVASVADEHWNEHVVADFAESIGTCRETADVTRFSTGLATAREAAISSGFHVFTHNLNAVLCKNDTCRNGRVPFADVLFRQTLRVVASSPEKCDASWRYFMGKYCKFHETGGTERGRFHVLFDDFVKRGLAFEEETENTQKRTQTKVLCLSLPPPCPTLPPQQRTDLRN